MSRIRPRTGLLSRLAGLVPFTRKREAEPQAVVATVAPPEPLTEDSFRMVLEEIVQDKDARANTKLQVISLIEFREAVGEKWNRVADKVMMIAEGVIQLHLGPGNVYGRQGQDFFLLLFRDCPPAEARNRALFIAKELGTRLVGDKVVGPDRPLALATEIGLDEVLGENGLNLFAIHNAVGEMRALLAQEERQVGDDQLRSWMKQRLTTTPEALPLRRHLQPSPPPPPKDPEPLRASLRPSTPLPKPVHRPIKTTTTEPPKPISAPSGMISSDERCSGPAPEWKVLRVNQAATDTLLDGDRPLPPETRLSMLWRPTWCAAGETIGAYRAYVQRHDVAGEAPLDGTHAYTESGATAQALDRFAIAAAIRAFRQSEHAGQGSIVVLPIHWATLYSTKRMELLAPMADVTQSSRKARLVVELFGIPPGMSAEDISGTIEVLRPLCRDVMMRSQLEAGNAVTAASAGASMVGVDLADLSAGERSDDDQLIARLMAFHAAAAEAGLGSFVWGVRRRKVVFSTVSGGFGFVNGPALMKDIARPAKVLPAPRARFATI